MQARRWFLVKIHLAHDAYATQLQNVWALVLHLDDSRRGCQRSYAQELRAYSTVFRVKRYLLFIVIRLWFFFFFFSALYAAAAVGASF